MSELVIEAEKNNLNKVLAFLEEELEKNECSMKAKIQLDVAVEEIFVNVASYAYESGVGKCTVTFDVDENRMAVIEFIDEGVPFNPLEKDDPDVTLPASQRQIGGLGIFMVKNSMDAMEYKHENNKNITTIKKTI